MKKGFRNFIIGASVIAGLVSAVTVMGKNRIKNYITPSRVFLTGNIHGKLGIDRLNEHNFPIQKELGKDDNLIILGDFGLIWDNNLEDEMLLDGLDKKRYNILFVDGTHENFDLLNTNYETVDLYGGKAHKIRDNIYHLIRGEIYTIGGKQYLVFGGGESSDKTVRTEGKNYWIEESPSRADWENLKVNLNKANNYVDYVLTHTPPSGDLRIIGADIGRNLGKGNDINKNLQLLSENIKYKKWFHGYHHLDLEISKKHSSIFNQIIEIK